VPLDGEYYRLVASRVEVLDTPELPNVEMHYFHVRPESGMEQFMDAWLGFGAPHHFVTNLGDHLGAWRRFAELLDLDYEEI
jgi:L-arabinose isomerase